MAAACLSLSASAVAWIGESASENDPALRLSAELEGGKRYRAGKIGVVELTGSYRQMGRQYGTLLRGELGTLYRDAIEDFFVKKRGFSEDRLRTIAKSLFDLYPRRYKEILYGMAETSGLGIEKHILARIIRE